DFKLRPESDKAIKSKTYLPPKLLGVNQNGITRSGLINTSRTQKTMKTQVTTIYEIGSSHFHNPSSIIFGFHF
ncbi:MAG: hypothetical protein ACM3SR_08170, partial [Ignavibacteriales bacterium]